MIKIPILMINKIYTGDELTELGYEIDWLIDKNESTRTWLAKNNVLNLIYEVLDIGNDNYKVLRKRRRL
jgi:hypothetical protein